VAATVNSVAKLTMRKALQLFYLTNARISRKLLLLLLLKCGSNSSPNETDPHIHLSMQQNMSPLPGRKCQAISQNAAPLTTASVAAVCGTAAPVSDRRINRVAGLS